MGYVEKRREEFKSCICDLLDSAEVRSMNSISAHSETNCFEHSLFVAYVSFVICKKLRLDFMSAARGGLLHDLFLYNQKLKGNGGFKHLVNHPHVAVINAIRLYGVNRIEQDIIAKHMWPLTLRTPRYIESLIVSTADKICAAAEVTRIYRLINMRKRLSFAAANG